MDSIRSKIYISGINRLACFVQEMIDPQLCVIMGFVSTEEVLPKESYRGFPCISRDDLSGKDYDYIIDCEGGKYDHDPRCIDLINCLTITCMRLSPEYYILRKKALYDMKTGGVNGIITGISSIQRGIIVEDLKYKTVLCAAPGQDLYYDFYSLADAIEREGKSLRYVIMGIVPYSFRYDLSLSSQSLRTLIYYHEFKDCHHAAFKDDDIKRMERGEALMDACCYSAWRDVFYDHLFDVDDRRVRTEFVYDELNDIEKNDSIERMRKLGNKPYPETLKENKLIFESYLKLCKKAGLRVIILVPPFCAFFREYFPREYVEEMRDIIRNAQIEMGVEVMDLYDDPDFDHDDLYADVDHLNVKGAIRVTDRINSLL